MKTTRIMAMAGLVLGLGFAACKDRVSATGDDMDRVQQAKEKVIDAKADLEKAREEYKMESQKALDENDRMLADLKAKNAEYSGRMKENNARRIDSLEIKNKEMRKRLDMYKDNDNGKWDNFKSEFNHDMRELGHALKDFTVDNKK